MDHREQALSASKKTVLSHHRLIDAAPDQALAEALTVNTSPNCRFQFTAPFRDCIGSEDAARTFWEPLRNSFSPFQRRPDIFFAGYNHLSDEPGVWVASMGHLLGLFDRPFLGMRPTRQA
ncbi:MAG: nuclear transport factor 2 family protein, partial [Pseudomonadota bacterium]